MVEFLYTRIILLLAAIGLVSMGLGGAMAIFDGQPATGLLTLILAVAIGWVWYRDWVRLGKCAKALEKAKGMLAQLK
jgi:hypothetical protein